MCLKKKVNQPCPAKLPFGPQGGSKWATSPKNTEKTGFSLKKHLLTIVRQSNVWQLLKILSWRTQWCSYFWSQGHLKVIKGHFKVIFGHFWSFSMLFQHIFTTYAHLFFSSPKCFFSPATGRDSLVFEIQFLSTAYCTPQCHVPWVGIWLLKLKNLTIGMGL